MVDEQDEDVIKRNAKAFSLNAIVDVRRRLLRRHELIFFKGETPMRFALFG